MPVGINLELLDNYLIRKIEENPKFIKCTFWEVRVNLNISEKKEKEFLNFARIRLENLGYSVYFTNELYFYDNEKKVVQTNELIIGIKNETKVISSKTKSTKTSRKRGIR